MLKMYINNKKCNRMKQTNTDEMRGRGKMSQQNRRLLLTIAFLCITVVLGISVYNILDYPESKKIETCKNEGESTILLKLQTAVDTIMLAEMEMFDILQGQAIVMDVKTGEILAMVGQERKHNGTFQPCKNFAYQQEQGPLMHTVSLLAALETDNVKLSDIVHTGNGVCPIEGGYEIKDHNWRRGGYGSITLDRALEISSNIGIGLAAVKAYGNNHQAFFDQLDKMSFGKPDFIEGIDGLTPTNYSSPSDKEWANWKFQWSVIGYERKIAPIQILTFYNAIANNGKMVKPTLKKGEIEIINPKIASKTNISNMQVVLEHVVSQGLGKKAGTPILKVAGKTATTQVGESPEGDDAIPEYNLAFCGYFPADKPKYSMIVSLNKLGLPASGGAMAGEAFHNIVEWMIDNEMIK